MTANTDHLRRFAHRANILKYQKILATYLTAEERRFVERRLGEEEAALRQVGNVAPSIGGYAA